MAIGLLVPTTGVWASSQYDLPTGPTIVLGNVLLLFACYVGKSLHQALQWKTVEARHP